MTRIAIVTNGFAALPADLVERYNITLVPMQIQFLTGTYEEGRDLGIEEFYHRLASEEVVPTTAPPTIQRYVRVFQELAASHDAVLSVHVSAALSDSYVRAQHAARQLGAQVVVYDSGSLAFGTGFQVLTAARMIEAGAGLPEVMAALQAQRDQTLALLTPATLRFVRNSQRAGPLAVLLATWLNIKPVLRLNLGRIDVIDRPRSAEAALERLLREIERFFDGAEPPELGVCHANAPEAAQGFAERLRARFPAANVLVSDVGMAVAVHLGPGALGLMSYRPGPPRD